jgi:SET domain-containing protein
MNPHFFSRPIHRDIHEFTPKLTNEFDPVYIQSLAFRERDEQAKFHWRKRLSEFGSWLTSLGRRIQHLAHLPFAVGHSSRRTIAVQSIKVRRHR